MLSFGDEADGDEEADDGDGAAFAKGVRFRSAHETLAEGDSRLEAAAVGVHDAHVADLHARIAREQVRSSALADAALFALIGAVFSKRCALCSLNSHLRAVRCLLLAAHAPQRADKSTLSRVVSRAHVR